MRGEFDRQIRQGCRCKNIVLDRFNRMSFEKRHVLEGGSMQNHLGSMLVEDSTQGRCLTDISDQIDELIGDAPR
jgi:hypothetical protein